jgi:hypothetical protein
MHNTSGQTFWRSAHRLAIAAAVWGVVVAGSLTVTAATPAQDTAPAKAGAQAGAPAAAAADGATIDETRLKSRPGPVKCMGVESVELDGVLLRVDAIAIQASGECRVIIKNSRVVGRDAVVATGKASITFENSIVEGSLRIMGDTVTSFKSSTVRGRIRKLQKAEVKDLGHNVWR